MKTATKLSSAVVALALVTPVSAAMTQTSALATKSDKVTICHATNSQTNPYVKITVNSSSINELNNPHGTNGHGDHDGGVWHKGIAAHSWGDIIPPFTSPAKHSYPGKNWTAQGQAVYAKGCGIVSAASVTKDNKDSKSSDNTLVADKSTTPVNLPAELPKTGASSLTWLGAGAATYGVSFLIRKLLAK